MRKKERRKEKKPVPEVLEETKVEELDEEQYTYVYQSVEESVVSEAISNHEKLNSRFEDELSKAERQENVFGFQSEPESQLSLELKSKQKPSDVEERSILYKQSDLEIESYRRSSPRSSASQSSVLSSVLSMPEQHTIDETLTQANQMTFDDSLIANHEVGGRKPERKKKPVLKLSKLASQQIKSTVFINVTGMLVLLCLVVLSTLQSDHVTFIDQLPIARLSDWDERPYIELEVYEDECPEGTHDVFSRTWHGTEAGCYSESGGVTTEEQCDVFSERIGGLEPIEMNTIYGKHICGTRSGLPFKLTVRPEIETNRCPEHLTPCSNHTSPDNTICKLESEIPHKCPITSIQITERANRDP